ncbi:hypothetical protein [Oceanibaculum nanhaiense]|uniref:hypothetical protein n=1 Tax=Oceanibaculum nanhaiense TaxID=1909734 RepID=UPI003F715EAD
MEIIYQGFDGLDFAIRANIPQEFADRLEEAQLEAQKTREPALSDYRGVEMHVAESGARGGYAFRCDTGKDGAIWFFKRPNPNDPWGVRVSLNSLALALYGLGGVREQIFGMLDALGMSVMPDGVSISRVDYAIDFLAPGFVLEPAHFVMHSRARRKDYFEGKQVNGKSDRVESVTIGTMPGKQIIVYDKRADVIAKNKREWWEIWNAGRRNVGKAELDRHDRDGAQIWRVELRAGKHHLKVFWGIRSFADLDNKLGDLYRRMHETMRYTLPRPDTHRSRWPVHPLWRMAGEAMAGDLAEMTSNAEPQRVKEIKRKAHAELLQRQIQGTQASLAVIEGYVSRDYLDFLAVSHDQAAVDARENPDDLEEKMAKARRRYVFM